MNIFNTPPAPKPAEPVKETKEVKAEKAAEPKEVSETEFLQNISKKLKNAQTSTHPHTLLQVIEAIDLRTLKTSADKPAEVKPVAEKK